MKKYIIGIITVTLFFFFIPKVDASTVLTQKQITNGIIEISLDLEEGYVGALDLEIVLNGNVSFQSIEWNSSLLDSYTKKYFYNESTKAIQITLATGDITKNLLDSKRNIVIGRIKVNADVVSSYYFNASKLTIVDTNYTSIPKTDLISDVTLFEYAISEVKPPNNNNNSNNTNDDITPKPDDTIPPKDDNTDDKENSDIENNNSEKKEDEKKADFTLLYVGIASIIVLGGIILITIKLRKRKREF